MCRRVHIQFLLIGPVFPYLIDLIKIAFFVPLHTTTSVIAQLCGNRFWLHLSVLEVGASLRNSPEEQPCNQAC
jgi:hypothetical protein